MMFQYSELRSFKLQNTLEKHGAQIPSSYSCLLNGSIDGQSTRDKNTALLFSCVPALFKETAGDRIVSDSNNSLVIIVIWVRLTKSVQQEP